MEIEADAKMRQAVDGHRGRGACPHLGLRDDAQTSFAFPAPANHCCWVRPPAAVQLEHQQEFCLTDWHVACPIFRREEAVTRPHPGPWAEEGRRPSLKVVAPAGLLLLLAALFLLRPWAAGPAGAGADGRPDAQQQVEDGADGFLPPLPGHEATATPSSQQTDGAAKEAPGTSRPTSTPQQPTQSPVPPGAGATDTPTAAGETPTIANGTQTATPCGPPAAWVTYVVRAGETLFQLALRYGVTVGRLQQANCLNTVNVDAGQVIYVPYRVPAPTATALPPTATPSWTPTATALPPTATSPPLTATSPPSTATSPPPTATSPPPTATSPPPTATAPPLPSPTPLATATSPISGAGR